MMLSDNNKTKKWIGKRIISGGELEEYFSSIKDKIIGKTLDKIFISGILFGECFENEDVLDDKNLVLDEPVILCFDDTHLELDYSYGSLVYVAENTLNIDEMRDVSNKFAENILGHKLVDIQIVKTDKVYFMNFESLGIERNDGDDMFDEIRFVFDNGCKLEISSDACDYMYVLEIEA